jgi:hypothetical protein
MSNTKKVFYEFCDDAAEQFSAGMSIKQVQSNIAFTAEHYGINMFTAIEVSERFGEALKNLHNKNLTITSASVADEYFRLANKSSV